MALPRFEDICQPTRCPTPDALEAARRMAATAPAFDTRLLQALNIAFLAHEVDLAVVERLLELLAEVAPPACLVPALRSALGHSEPSVRSKAALLLGRRVENVETLRHLVSDGDARVRANTVEALWGRTNDDTRALFDNALGDLHHRVAANAAYGLYLIDPAGNALRLARFVRHPHPRFRRAGSWILRRIGDPANLKLLQALVTDKNAEVRSSAFSALISLRRVAMKRGLSIEDSPQTP